MGIGFYFVAAASPAAALAASLRAGSMSVRLDWASARILRLVRISIRFRARSLWFSLDFPAVTLCSDPIGLVTSVPACNENGTPNNAYAAHLVPRVLALSWEQERVLLQEKRRGKLNRSIVIDDPKSCSF
jgi:hypothetical protein